MKYKFSLREKVLVGLCIVVVVCFLAHRQVFRFIAHAHFDSNAVLTEEERQYAKRYYDFIMKHPNMTTISPNISGYDFKSDLYKKWGLGRKRFFIKPEKQYICGIAGIEEQWRTYNKELKEIDLNNLSEFETAYLKKIHNKYGSKTVDWRKEIKEGKDEFFIENSEFYEFWLQFLSEVFDLKETDDLTIILLFRLERKAVI